jgi:hypothetical protein
LWFLRKNWPAGLWVVWVDGGGDWDSGAYCIKTNFQIIFQFDFLSETTYADCKDGFNETTLNILNIFNSGIGNTVNKPFSYIYF